MRLVDADTLNYVRVRIYHDDGTIGGYNAVVPSSEIKNAPTVDAVPVIRCKDCKYNNGGRCGWHGGAGYKWIVDDDDFCSCGEKKE